MPRLIDITGQTFGSLTVIGRAPGSRTKWKCLCSCGATKAIPSYSLRHGLTRSCGCLHREVRARGTRLRHGQSRSKLYRVWRTMLERCENPSNPKFNNYGARGIRVCERWREFDNFYADMGPRPSARHSIDRRNNDGNYEPGNCRWATPAQQAANRRGVVLVSSMGVTQSVHWWARELGIPHNTVRRRVKAGWTIEQIKSERNRRGNTRPGQDEVRCQLH